MIKRWNEFIKEEYSESENYLDAKMSEIKDLLDNIDQTSLIYNWENKNDKELDVNFSNGTLSTRYEFDIDELKITKLVKGKIDFSTIVSSIDDGIEVIEKDIKNILNID